MKNQLSIPYLILLTTALCFGCRGPVKTETKSNAPTKALSLHVGNEKYYKIDNKQSVVEWKGANSFGAHKGYISISKGELRIKNGELMGGTVEVDMNTIEDENHKANSGLIKHLKNPDFFEVEKFPFATIEITKVASLNDGNKSITGKLTIKEITQEVTFPAKIEIKDGMVTTDGKLVIDRTKWNVSYQSAKFYQLLADKTISDSIEFHMKIVAKK